MKKVKVQPLIIFAIVAIFSAGVLIRVYSEVRFSQQDGPDLRYDGPYIDLLQEARFEKEEPSDDLTIRKIDTSTGYGVVASIGDIVLPQFTYDGREIQLRFEDHVLTGFRKTYNGLVEMVSGDTPYEEYSEESQHLIQQFATHLTMEDNGWNTSDLDKVLESYVTQVEEFLAEHE